MAGTISTTVELTGSFLTAGPMIQAEVDALITVTGEAVRQGAEDRSRYDETNDEPGHIHMRDAWVFVNEGNQSGSVFNDEPQTVFNEYGTRFMTAQPMLQPSIDAARPGFEAALREIVNG